MRKESHTLWRITKYLQLVLVTPLLFSCLISQSGSSSKSSGGSVSNTTYTVNPNYGRYFFDNPIINSGNESLSVRDSLSLYLDSDQKFITNNQFLIGSCTFGSTQITKCFEVREDESSGYLSATENRWAFNPTEMPEEFLQVQAYGNMRDMTEKFHESLSWSYDIAQGYGYDSAIPYELNTSDENPFWYRSGLLKGYANCDEKNNAYYDPASKSLCLGAITDISPTLYMATDPTITYHELGHAYTHITINMRHKAHEMDIDIDSSLGQVFYDEAGSIGEGLSDFYSFYMTERTHFAEWGLGRYIAQSRPMSEDEDIHAPGINLSTTGRLSYPDYVNYDPNEPAVPYEDVHYGGQIASHFLHAFYTSLLASDLVDTDYGVYYADKDEDGTTEEYSYADDLYHCGMTKKNALNMTMHLVFESLAELGDQTATGFGALSNNVNDYKVNLDPENALEWMAMVKPINFRSFFQAFSKYFLNTVGNNSFGMCNGSAYDRDEYEKLLDRYGLLLFKTYNQDGNNMNSGHSGTHTAVTTTNRVNTVLIAKNMLKLDDRSDSASAFVIDSQADIHAAMEALILSGQVAEISEQIDDNFAYNNGNAQISPGEVVGIALNLYNNSNSTMGGIQVLANDWDHFKDYKPCNNLGDNFPLDSEGAATLLTDEGVEGGCDYVTRYNGKNPTMEPNEDLAPVCFIEYSDSDATKWVNQNIYRQEIGLAANKCLGGADSLNDCFIRVIKGGDQAYYSKLDPKSTWSETLDNDSTGTPTFTTSNVIFMEVNESIPPGTTFNCRMRARFTNCSDCYHDESNGNDDYLDYEFSGAKPFKIVNFQFTVID